MFRLKRILKTAEMMRMDAENSEKGFCSADFLIENRFGLHARPASVFVQTALSFQSEISVHNLSTDMAADGKSVMSLLMLAASTGTKIRITARGPDSREALQLLGSLVRRGFDDE